VHILKEKLTKSCQQFGAMLLNSKAKKYLSTHGTFDCASCKSKKTLHLAADACFKLRRERRTPLLEKEPKINNFFISKQNQEILKDKLDFSMEISTTIGSCGSDFKAASLTKKSHKFDEKAVVGLFCARHETPLLFVDCFTGERYGYVDMLLIEYLKNKKEVQNVLFYYDVGCRYISHLNGGKMQSVCKYFSKIIRFLVREEGLDRINFKLGVPAMHVKAHGFPCPWRYNPKYLENNGKTDGETSERAWSYLGRFAPVTKSMTAANRRDTLEMAVFNYFMKTLKNQEKNINSKLGKVRVERETERYKSFNHLIRLEDGALQKYRTDLLERFDKFLENEILKTKGKQSRAEQLNSLIRGHYLRMYRLFKDLYVASGQREKKAINEQIQQCRMKMQDVLTERRQFEHPPSFEEVTNFKSDFWQEFSHNNASVGDMIAEVKVLHRFDRLNEEEKMLENEGQNVRDFHDLQELDDDIDSDIDDENDAELLDIADILLDISELC
jgi:hypothetical protein